MLDNSLAQRYFPRYQKGRLKFLYVAVALIERIEGRPRSYLEAAAGLGLRQSQIVWSVVLPQSLSGNVVFGIRHLRRFPR